jgi:hypothetical protein
MDKKRSGPDPVEPVSFGGTRYEAMQWGKARGLEQNGGYVAAIDEKTGDELWLLKVYDVSYDGDMEDDKQDVFVTSLELDRDGRRLMVDNEAGNRFAIDLATRTVSAA